MAQDYDKIFKENIEEIIMPLAEKILHIQTEALEEIPDDLQRTIERKPDFLKKVTHAESSRDYILHIEFQKEDETDMVFRMLEYCAILLRQYKLPVRQYIFFIGSGKSKMRYALQYEHLQYAFEVKNIQDFTYQTFLESNKPEEVILAVLADFGTDKPETVINTVLYHLRMMPVETLRKEKCVKQLEILSNLRNLQRETIKLIEKMPLTYDLEKDIRFQQGKEAVIGKLLKNSTLSTEEIARMTEVPVAYVQELAEKIRK